MGKLLIAGLAGIAAVTTVTPAQAFPNYHYHGGCGFFTISDGTSSASTRWQGEVHAVAVATDHSLVGTPQAVSIKVECELRINGQSPGTIVLSTPTDVGVTANASRLEFEAHPDDVVVMCDHVTVGGEYHKDCGDGPSPPIVPQPVQDLVEATRHEVDGRMCRHLAVESGGPADRPPAFDIRSDGDVYVNGEWVYDCPPYGVSGT